MTKDEHDALISLRDCFAIRARLGHPGFSGLMQCGLAYARRNKNGGMLWRLTKRGLAYVAEINTKHEGLPT